MSPPTAEETHLERRSKMAQDAAKAYGQVIARAWSDPAFAAKLKSDPAAALAEAGVEVPDGAKVTSYFAEENEVVVLVPAKPSEELSDEALEAMAGGGTKGSAGTAGTAACPIGTFGCAGTAGSH
ncbi:MAG: thiocillin family RiPP [Alphaproteobacteria bacterium]|nr:MAG: thiocillin family RiPP [Alphaproteobacteria bacterium]